MDQDSCQDADIMPELALALRVGMWEHGDASTPCWSEGANLLTATPPLPAGAATLAGFLFAESESMKFAYSILIGAIWFVLQLAVVPPIDGVWIVQLFMSIVSSIAVIHSQWSLLK